jgi:hypothetical protein
MHLWVFKSSTKISSSRMVGLCRIFFYWQLIDVRSDKDPIGEVLVDMQSLDLRNRAMQGVGPLELDLPLEKVPHGSIQLSIYLQTFDQ